MAKRKDIRWDKVAEEIDKASFGRESAIVNLDTPDGQAQELKGIINRPDEKTENRLRALDLLSDLRGTKKLKDISDIKRMDDNQLMSIAEDVIEALKPFGVRRK